MNRSSWPMGCMALVMLFASTVSAADDALLPEPAQRLQFIAEEGTWLSLDVSPDGRKIVFDLLGDLYELPIGGGDARRLTSGSAFDAQPRYSPDGRSIAFVSDRDGADNVWVVDVDGARPRVITTERERIFISPEWTPDGHSIVVSRSTGTNVNIYGRDVDLTLYPASGGGAGVSLTDRDDGRLSTLGAAFGADSNVIFGSRGVLREYGSWQLVRLDRSTGRVDPWTRRLGGGLRPTLSPDGRFLAYVTRVAERTVLNLMELATGEERTLVPDFERDEQEGWAPMRDLAAGASFTPDGAALIVSFGGKIRRVDIRSGAITLIPFRAPVDIGVTPRQAHDYDIADDAVIARRLEQPSYSPNGRDVAFSALGRIWIQPGDASSPRQLSPEGANAFHPTWSPDGRHVAYVTWDDLEGGTIWRIRADGKTRPQRLTQAPGFYEGIAYSRDGKRIVAIRSPRQLRMSLLSEPEPQLRGELVWLPAAGGDVTTITAVRDAPVGQLRSLRAGTPHFTNDPERVFFKDPVEGLTSVRWDGSDRRVELRVTGWDGLELARVLADEMLISPDGRRVLALINNQAWLIELNGQREITLPEQGVSMTRLTRAGADFIGWSHDSAAAHWALGSSLFMQSESDRRDITVRIKRNVTSDSIVLSGARVVTMRGHEVIESADVVVTGNRIAAVGPRGDVAIPDNARVIDLTGKTLLPGFVDIHSHNWPAWGVHRRQVWQYLAHLAYGVTSIRDPQTETLDVLTYGDRVALGDILGPRVFSTGRGVYPAEGIRSPEDARDIAQRYGQFFRTQTLKSYRPGARRVRQWLLDAANSRQLTVTAEGNGDFKMNLTLAMDGFAGVEHSFAPTLIYDDAIRLFAASGITYTPTILEGVPRLEGEHLFYREHDVYDDAKLRRFLPEAELARKSLRPWMTLAHPNQFATTPVAEQAGKILAAGGRVGLGSHGALAGLGTHWELWLLGKGMSAHDALRVATIMSAEAIGHGRNFGSIEAGKLADLQILERNPLDDLRHSTSIRYVMSDGRLFDAATLNQLWPRVRPLEPQWWQSIESRAAGPSQVSCP